MKTFLIKNISLLSVLFAPLVYFFTSHFIGIYPFHDTQFIFDHYKYINDYFLEYKKINLWITENHYGYNSFILATYIGSIGFLLSFLSFLLSFNDYFSFLALISIYYSIILF